MIEVMRDDVVHDGMICDGGAVRVGAGDSSDGTSAGGSIDLVAGSSAGAASTGMGGSIGLSGGEGAAGGGAVDIAAGAGGGALSLQSGRSSTGVDDLSGLVTLASG